MNDQKKSVVIVISLALTAAVIFFPILANASVSSDHENYDFGDVVIGSSSTAIVNISNPGSENLELTGLVFQEGTCGFSVRSQLPVVLPRGKTVRVEINFAPLALGPCYDILNVFTGVTHITGEVVLSGTGVETLEKSLTIEELLEFFDTFVYYESLEGYDTERSTEQQLNDLQSMLEEARNLLEKGNIDEARDQLMAVYKKTDSLNTPGTPSSFVQRDAAGELLSMIQRLVEKLTRD